MHALLTCARWSMSARVVKQSLGAYIGVVLQASGADTLGGVAVSARTPSFDVGVYPFHTAHAQTRARDLMSSYFLHLSSTTRLIFSE